MHGVFHPFRSVLAAPLWFWPVTKEKKNTVMLAGAIAIMYVANGKCVLYEDGDDDYVFYVFLFLLFFWYYFFLPSVHCFIHCSIVF